jgi:broad specificity phosphatase PhoE
MQSPTRLYLIRHGEVESRYHRVFGGTIDMELSPFGHEQALDLANRLESIPFQTIYASPMKRVQQTLAELVARQSKLPIVLRDLREVDFGAWTGLSWDEVSERFQVSAFEWLDQLRQGLISGAESVADFRERVDRALQHILEESPGKTVAVVCHGGVIRMALSLLLDLPLERLAAFNVEYASFTIIDCEPRKNELQLLNFTPWRDKA